MYYPYLRARQFELIALRELVIEGELKNTITPILEPVKESFSNLDLAYKVFKEHDYTTYLIVNPFKGEVSGDNDIVLKYIQSLDGNTFLPAFHFCDNRNFIENCIKEYGLENCLIIGLDSFSNEDEFKELSLNTSVTKVMLLEPNKNRSLDRYFKRDDLGIEFIRLDDVFEKQQKNSDFLSIAAHKFSEEHLYYTQEQYKGFADFTVLPREFAEGGSIPRAVVIHLTYLNEKEEQQIWIRHFTSSTSDSIANVQGKFAEAARKALDFCNKHGFANSAINELRKCVENTKYPGLGTVKKISIKNHLLVISNYLSEVK